MTCFAGRHDALGDALDPVRVRDRGSTVLLDDEGHGGLSTSRIRLRDLTKVPTKLR
jgi:hypothetical protein